MELGWRLASRGSNMRCPHLVDEGMGLLHHEALGIRRVGKEIGADEAMGL